MYNYLEVEFTHTDPSAMLRKLKLYYFFCGTQTLNQYTEMCIQSSDENIIYA